MGRILLRPTLPAEKKPGAQLDSSYASPTLSLLDLRFLSHTVTLRADGSVMTISVFMVSAVMVSL